LKQHGIKEPPTLGNIELLNFKRFSFLSLSLASRWATEELLLVLGEVSTNNLE
jgi:hypothetical protein